MSNHGRSRFGDRWSGIIFAGGLVLLLPVWNACESEPTVPTQSNPPDLVVPGPPVDAIPFYPIGGVTQTFVVLQYNEAAGGYLRAANATVAFDAPGGVRKLARTGWTGLAQFKSIDWTKGHGAVTVVLEGHPIVSYLGLDPARVKSLADESGIIPIYLPSREQMAEETVSVTGHVRGLKDKLHHFVAFVANSAIKSPESVYEGPGTEGFSLDVLKGKSSIIQAYEYRYRELASGLGYERPIFQVMQLVLERQSGDLAGVMLDFNMYAVGVHALDMIVSMPLRGTSPIRSGALPECGVCQQGASNCHGFATYVEVAPSLNQFEVDLLWTQPIWGDEAFWYCTVQKGERSATTVTSGYPTRKSIGVSMMDTPRWLTKASVDNPHPSWLPFEFEYFEKVAASSLVITAESHSPTVNPRVSNEKVVWILDLAPESQSVTLPALPKGIDRFNVLGTHAKAQLVGGVLGSRGLEPYRGQVWKRYAKSRYLPIER